jgi:hypothetical protein
MEPISSPESGLSISQEMSCLDAQVFLLPYSQEAATRFYPPKIKPNPCPHLFRIKFNIILPPTRRSSFQVPQERCYRHMHFASPQMPTTSPSMSCSINICEAYNS